MSALLPNTARAKTDECTAVVTACDRALADQDKVINLKTQEITAQKEVIAAQDTRIQQLEKDRNSIFKNPLLYIGLGILAGVLVAK